MGEGEGAKGRTFEKSLESGYFLLVGYLLEFYATCSLFRSLYGQGGERKWEGNEPLVRSANAFLPTTLSFWFSTNSIPCASSVFWRSVRFMSVHRTY